MRNRVFIIGVFALGILLYACTQDPERAGDTITDQLNNEIKTGNFEKIYFDMSESARSLTTRDEFISNMNRVVAWMKEYDDSLNWKKGNLRLSNEYKDVYFIHREMEKNGKKLDVTVTISRSMIWRFYDLCVMPSEPATGGVCVTNALRKI